MKKPVMEEPTKVCMLKIKGRVLVSNYVHKADKKAGNAQVIGKRTNLMVKDSKFRKTVIFTWATSQQAEGTECSKFLQKQLVPLHHKNLKMADSSGEKKL